MRDTLSHPAPEELAAFLQGRLSSDRQQEIEQHVAGCTACCEALERLPDDTLLGRLKMQDTQHLRVQRTAELATRPVDTLPIPAEFTDHPRYRVLRAIGAGGMGVVYLAEHRMMGRTVAIKVLHRELTSNAVAVRRFRVEVKAAAQLDHPNIVQAYDADQAGELHFLAMEYVEGVSLANVVRKRGPLPIVQACNYGRQVAAGLEHAHKKGMVHRDIKPQNLMLTPQGQVKILDFGLAQFARVAQESESPLPPGIAHRSGTIITAAGSVFGTPDYIAPEQAIDSRTVDIRADIYSLGCTLYYLLRGEPPFPVGSAEEKLQAHQFRPAPSLAEGTRAVPAELARVVERTLAKNPLDRFATPAEVVEALAPFSQLQPIGEPPPLPPAMTVASPAKPNQPARRRRLPTAALAFLAAVAMTIVGLRMMPLDDRSGSAAKSASKPAPVAFTPTPSKVAARRPVVLFLVSRRYYSSDYQVVRQTLEEGGADVELVSTGPCRPLDDSTSVSELQPDLAVPRDTLRIADYDALYIPGGYIFEYKDNTPARPIVSTFIDEMLASGKPVAALGHGQGVLAAKGTLADRRVAPNDFVRQKMPGYAASFADTPVAVDGPIITAGDASAGAELARTLLSEIGRHVRSPAN
jgi:serine/threonine protein kinase